MIAGHLADGPKFDLAIENNDLPLSTTNAVSSFCGSSSSSPQVK